MHARRPSKGLALLALFHPDCNRRLRNLTGSADLRGRPRSARGLRPPDR